MPVAEKFCWDRIDDEQFEELVYTVLQSFQPVQIKWRKGPGDKGRDIQAKYRRSDALGEGVEETYFVEVKHYKSGVPPTAITGTLAWAQAQQPEVLMLALSSHLTTPCREHVEAWVANNPGIRVVIWERKEMENKILGSASARNLAITFGLLPASINELLPPNPDAFRTGPGDTGVEMEFRYWITEEEVAQLDYVVALLQRLHDVIVAECGPHKYFEDVCLGIPNWSTFLTLFQAESRLQIAIRDYLFTLVTNAMDKELPSPKEKVKAKVEEVRKVGESSLHVD